MCYFIVYGNEDEIFHLEPESHILTVNATDFCRFNCRVNVDLTFLLLSYPSKQILKELDREVKPNHTLIVKATENCTHKPSNITLPKSAPLSRSYHSALIRTNGQTKYLDWFNRYKHSRSLRSISDDDVAADGTDEHHDAIYFQSLVSGILSDDNTLVQVIVQVDDINDNAPEFVNKIFTGKC